VTALSAPGQNRSSDNSIQAAGESSCSTYRHAVDTQISFYAVHALQANHDAAHYDLGAGGRSITTDGHDGSQITAINGDATPAPGGPFNHTGGTVQVVSIGMTYKF